MSNDTMRWWTASEAAAAVRTRQITSEELVLAAFARIDEINPRLGAMVWQDRPRALEHARAADHVSAEGRSMGLLHGVPITIKESFAYEGSPNAWGVAALANANSPRTATAIARLESAGAIVIGKTNVPVMLGDWQTFNPIAGTTNNPWDLTRTPGGSTGGGAAALASGIGYLTMGSDLSGSIRVPAHFCGVYGHKPSLNLISAAGFQPGPWDGSPEPAMDLGVVGPLARDARDLALALEVLGGPAPEDAVAWSWRLPEPRAVELSEFRVGYVIDDKTMPVSSDVRVVYERALDALRLAGVPLTAGWPAGLDVRRDSQTHEYLLMAFVNRESRSTHAKWVEETRRRLAFRNLWRRYFQDVDVFLCPAAFTPAFPHDHSEPMDAREIDTADGKRPYMLTPAWSWPATLAGIPATVAPVGLTPAGLPVGLQILGPLWEDRTCIEFAARLAEAVGGFVPPPGIDR